jgi:hypothetical protein
MSRATFAMKRAVLSSVMASSFVCKSCLGRRRDQPSGMTFWTKRTLFFFVIHKPNILLTPFHIYIYIYDYIYIYLCDYIYTHNIYIYTYWYFIYVFTTEHWCTLYTLGIFWVQLGILIDITPWYLPHELGFSSPYNNEDMWHIL